MQTPCYTTPKNYYFTREEFGKNAVCEVNYGVGNCDNCHTLLVLNNYYPFCNKLKPLFYNPWDEDCNKCFPTCPSVAHPVGTWDYLIETGTINVGGKILSDITSYYEDCILPATLTNPVTAAIQTGIKTVAKIAVGMACPECLAAYSFLDIAKEVADIFTQILYLDDYILAGDFYNQG